MRALCGAWQVEAAALAPAPSGSDALAVAAVADGSNVTAGGEVGAVTGLEQVTVAQRFSKDGGTCRLPVVYKCARGPPPCLLRPASCFPKYGCHAGASCWANSQAACSPREAAPPWFFNYHKPFSLSCRGELMTDCLDIGGASSCFTGDGVPHECAPLGPGTPENQPLADLLISRNGTGDGASGALCVLENADASAVPGNATLPHCDSALACTPLKVRNPGGH